MNPELFTYRKANTEKDCPGLLVFENDIVCHTLEDIDRGLHQGMTRKQIIERKIYGITAIPYGRYEIMWYDSPKHGRVPMLRAVPGFSYVQIHILNTAVQSLGCIGVGMIAAVNHIINSRIAFEKVCSLIREHDIKFINIEKMK